MSDFKKCPNGHFYEGDNCPYCEDVKKKPINMVKVCPNRHAYNVGHSMCPICDSTAVIDQYESGHDTIEAHPIRFVNPQTVKVNGQYYYDISHIYVNVSRGYKHGYAFSKNGEFEDYIWIDHDAEIQIGETMIKGKELIKMCDLVLDNNMSLMVHYRFSTTIEVRADNLIPL